MANGKKDSVKWVAVLLTIAGMLVAATAWASVKGRDIQTNASAIGRVDEAQKAEIKRVDAARCELEQKLYSYMREQEARHTENLRLIQADMHIIKGDVKELMKQGATK